MSRCQNWNSNPAPPPRVSPWGCLGFTGHSAVRCPGTIEGNGSKIQFPHQAEHLRTWDRGDTLYWDTACKARAGAQITGSALAALSPGMPAAFSQCLVSPWFRAALQGSRALRTLAWGVGNMGPLKLGQAGRNSSLQGPRVPSRLLTHSEAIAPCDRPQSTCDTQHDPPLRHAQSSYHVS